MWLKYRELGGFARPTTAGPMAGALNGDVVMAGGQKGFQINLLVPRPDFAAAGVTLPDSQPDPQRTISAATTGADLILEQPRKLKPQPTYPREEGIPDLGM